LVRDTHSYDYAVLRIVPSVEREEFANAGVVLHCPELAYLACRVEIDEGRLRALWPALNLEIIRSHLEAFPKICAGDPGAGPIARLSRRERFQWLVSPRSTIIQVSPVHSGMCASPEAAVEEIFRRLVQV
jgi:hypothetical protein